jgi:hypothetical protein
VAVTFCRGTSNISTCAALVARSGYRCEACRAIILAKHNAGRGSRAPAPPEKKREYARKHYAGKGRERGYTRRRSQYGFTDERIAELELSQGGACAICRQPWELFSDGRTSRCTDHNHEANTPRGLLCHHCNVSLGRYEKYQRRTLRIEPYETYLEQW